MKKKHKTSKTKKRKSPVKKLFEEYDDSKETKELNDWIDANGSERLRLARELGLVADTEVIYVNERLELEYPGYVLLPDGDEWCFEDFENPSLEALRALKEVREKLPDACLGVFFYNGDNRLYDKYDQNVVISGTVEWAAKFCSGEIGRFFPKIEHNQKSPY